MLKKLETNLSIRQLWTSWSVTEISARIMLQMSQIRIIVHTGSLGQRGTLVRKYNRMLTFEIAKKTYIKHMKIFNEIFKHKTML